MRFVLTLAIPLSSTLLIAQKNEPVYIYGTLHGESQSITGYFWFDNTLTQMGQHIWYKESLESKKKKTLYAIKFPTFESDSIFLRKFRTIPAGTGRLDTMLPRILKGKIELHNAVYRGYYSFSQSDHFYIYTGSESVRLVRRKFKEQMTQLLADDADIVRRIENGKATYDDMPAIIHNYNIRHPL